MNPYTLIKPYILSIVPIAAALPALYILGQKNYLFFHILAESFSIFTACGIFVIAWNARNFMKNHFLLLVGIAFLFVGGIDFLHTLGYKGMNIFQGYGANLATQLWIAGRYLMVFSLLLATAFIHRRIWPRTTFTAYAVITGVLIATIFYWRIFPDCYIEGIGLTPFKIYSEYVICVVIALVVGILIRHAKAFDPKVFALLIAALLLSIAQDLLFTTYLNVYGPANLIGHLLKIISFYLVYKAIITTALLAPWNLLFRELAQSESALRKAKQELEFRVEERTEELVKANAALLESEHKIRIHSQALEETNRDLADFNHLTVHDLQEPLRIIITLGDLWSAKCGDCENAEAKYLVGRIQNAAKRMSRLVRDINKYAIIDYQHEALRQIDLTAIMKEILSDFEDKIAQTGALVEVDELPNIAADENKIREVFTNLLSNALKFTNDSTPVIRISAQTETDGNRYRIFFKDNGIGFDEIYMDKIFAPFQRLNDKSQYDGSGIGLSLCRKVLQRCGGSITAESKPGRGATFIVTLPVCPPAKTPTVDSS